MRLISQHGNVDLPYEQIVVCHAMESVIALYNGEKYVLGKYSSKEKAYKAMQMLREAYTGKPKLNVNEIPNLTPQEFGEKLGISDILLCDKTNADVSFSSNYYFQFPQDDEIEV